jgi:transposase
MEIDPHNLPSEVNLLQQIVLQLLQVVEDKGQLLTRVQHQLAQLLRYRYGQKRERIDENQLFLFAAQIIAASQRASAATSSEEPLASAAPSRADSKEKKEKLERRGHGRKPLPESLERRRVVFDLEESQRQCRHCQTPMQKIGEDVSERLEFIPASLQIIEEVRLKYACAKGCGVSAAEKPTAPIEKGLPGPGLLAQVAVSKYGDHIPLNRMESIFERHGVELSRKTMCDWMAACAELASPVWERMKEVVLTSKAVQTDDTPVPVLDRERTRTRTGRIWTYVGDRNCPYIVYDYTGNRSREGPEEFLKGYNGYLQADAYAGYDAMFKNRKQYLTEVACWAHSRRYFFEAQTSDLCRATVMLAYIQLLYEVERQARKEKLNPEQRRELRQAKSRPILQDIQAYLLKEKPNVLPKSAIGGAIDYTLSNWEALLRYTEDGDLEIDNNGAERSLRPIVIGRNNWMFYGSDKGGRTGAVLSTLIASCKRLRVEPFAYLRDLFKRISSHPHHRLDELLPDQWLVAQRKASTAYEET